jgi:polyhydroxyalkanoate synthase
MEIAGVKLDLGKVTIPVFNLATTEDHIAPPQSVFCGSSFFGGPVSFVLTGSGHIAGVINPPSRNKYQYWTGPTPRGSTFETWRENAEEHLGSWWPYWHEWVTRLHATEVKARRVGSRALPALEDAPGSYVKTRA